MPTNHITAIDRSSQSRVTLMPPRQKGSAADNVGLFGRVVSQGREDDAAAFAILRRLVGHVRPVMERRKWRVGTLREFFPENPGLLGLNVNHGLEIRIRLRPAHAPLTFLPYTELLGTLLHELTHIKCGPHDQKFYALLDEITTECEADLAGQNLSMDDLNGGEAGGGERLGGKTSGGVAPREAAAKAAERRTAAAAAGIGGAPVRLGGKMDHRGKSPREMAAMAAIRRAQDNATCGTQQEMAEGEQAEAEERPAGGKRPWQEEDRQMAPKRTVGIVGKEEATWSCSVCTFINQPRWLQCDVCGAERRDN